MSGVRDGPSPHGVRDGDLLSVDGRHGKPGSPPGELSIRVDVLDSDLLKLDKDGTLRCDVPVDGFAWIANRSVDDQPSKLLTYDVILRELGDDLIMASSAQEALEQLLKNEIAVVLMDVCMPDLDGFQLAAMIRDRIKDLKTMEVKGK